MQKVYTNSSIEGIFGYNFTSFNQLIEEKSYLTISSCVFEHILSTTELTHIEKLFYIAADSLSLINKNRNKHRSIALSSKEWSTRLLCTKSSIFTMQKNLEKKGYFIIKKAFDKIGRNKRNLITPTLPESVFNRLKNEFSDRYNLSNISTECKRSYFDDTKLFVKINYQLLLTIINNTSLNSRQKIIWMDCYIRSYKSYQLSLKKSNKFSFICCYKELAKFHSCDIKSISKFIKTLEKFDFIKTEKFYIKKDQSLWRITLSLPNDCTLKIVETKNRSNIIIKNQSEKLINDPFIDSNSSINYLVLGGKKIQLNPEQILLLKSAIQNTDKNTLHLTNSQTEINKYNETKGDLFTLNDFSKNSSYLDDTKYDTLFAKSIPLLNKDFKIEKVDKEKIDKKEKSSTSSISESKKSISNFLKTKESEKEKSKTFTLLDFYPLNEKICLELQRKSGKKFDLNAMNEILKDMSKRLSNRRFKGEKEFMSYMSKAFANEMRDACEINNIDFRINANKTGKEQISYGKEKFLSQIEESQDISPKSILKQKLAATLNPDKAYALLTSYKAFNVNKNIFEITLHKEIDLSDLEKKNILNQVKSVFDQNENLITEVIIKLEKSHKKQTDDNESDVSLNNVWDIIRTNFQEQYGKIVYKSWFKNVNIAVNERNKLIEITTSTRFIQDFIKDRYLSYLSYQAKEHGDYLLQFQDKE